MFCSMFAVLIIICCTAFDVVLKAKRRKQEEVERQKTEDQAKRQQVCTLGGACISFYIDVMSVYDFAIIITIRGRQGIKIIIRECDHIISIHIIIVFSILVTCCKRL